MEDFKWTKKAERLWDEKAESWNAKSMEMWESGSRKDIVPFIQKHVHSGAHICDLGCGDGYGTYKLALSGYKCMGVDFSSEMIKRASSRKPGLVDFQQGDISSISVEPGTFDSLVAINSLEWTENPLAVLLEMKRILKPGGLSCVGILGPTAMPRINSYRRLYGEKVICNTMMPWEFEQLAVENGWVKKDEIGIYKRGVHQQTLGSLPTELKQALSFMWVFMLENREEESE